MRKHRCLAQGHTEPRFAPSSLTSEAASFPTPLWCISGEELRIEEKRWESPLWVESGTSQLQNVQPAGKVRPCSQAVGAEEPLSKSVLWDSLTHWAGWFHLLRLSFLICKWDQYFLIHSFIHIKWDSIWALVAQCLLHNNSSVNTSCCYSSHC